MLCRVLRDSWSAATGGHILRALATGGTFLDNKRPGSGEYLAPTSTGGGIFMGMDPYGGGGDPTPATFWRPRESERGAYTEKKWGAETLAVWELNDLPADAVVTNVTMMAYRGDKAVVAWKNGVQTLPEGAAQPGESAEAAARR